MSDVEHLKSEIAELRAQLQAQSQALLTERENYIRLFDNSSGFVAIMKGPTFVYTYVNPAHKKIVKADFTGRSIFEAAPQAKNLHGVLRQVFETGEPFMHHRQEVKITGEIHYMNANYVPTRDASGKVDGIIAWGLDISEQINANEALRTGRNLRERFVLALTHDLRTPLTSMKLVAQMLERKTNDPKFVALSTSRILKAIGHTERMILNLLDANRIQVGEKLPHKPVTCSFDQIVQEVLGNEKLIHGDRFDYVYHAGKVVGEFDQSGIQRVVENLLENTVKYGFTDSRINISLKLNNGMVELCVHNDGTPISEEDQKRVFIPYERTEAAKHSDQRGWGIGLALVKAIVESHDGSISIESSKETGTEFRISIPFKAESEI